MFRLVFPLLIAIAAIGCAKEIPDPGQGDVDFDDPKSVVGHVFFAARSGDTSRLSSLCPADGGNASVRRICAVTSDGPDWVSFRDNFARGHINGEPRVSGETAVLKFLYGPDGTTVETMTLRRAGGRWLLERFSTPRRTHPITLGLLFGLAALLVSRVVLVGHEFLGHGGAAWLLGGELRDHRLFLFGGGWVLTRVPERTLGGDVLISLGGVALELFIAIVTLLWLRRRERSPVITTAALIGAGVCFVHLGVYLCLGTHYGYGDGRLLHTQLGGARVVAVVIAGVVAVLAALWLTTAVRRALAGHLGRDSRLAISATLAGAVVIGAALHGGLMLAERAITDDPTYRQVMRGEAERRAHLLAAQEARARELAGEAMDRAELDARIRALADRDRPFPLRWPLYVAVALAALVGLVRGATTTRAQPPIRWTDLRPLAIATALAIASVAALWSPWWR